VDKAVGQLNDEDLAKQPSAPPSQSDFAAGRISDRDLLWIIVIALAIVVSGDRASLILALEESWLRERTASLAACSCYCSWEFDSSFTPETAGVWLDVPYVKQSEDGCGSAVISMLLEYWNAHGAGLTRSAPTPQQSKDSFIRAKPVAFMLPTWKAISSSRAFACFLSTEIEGSSRTTKTGPAADREHSARQRQKTAPLRGSNSIDWQSGAVSSTTRAWQNFSESNARNSKRNGAQTAIGCCWLSPKRPCDIHPACGIDAGSSAFAQDHQAALVKHRAPLTEALDEAYASRKVRGSIAGSRFRGGIGLGAHGRWSAARLAFEAGVRKAPNDSRFRVELAGIAYKQKDFRTAKDNLHRALRLNPQDAYSREFLATIYFLEGNLEAALKYWNPEDKPRLGAWPLPRRYSLRNRPEPRTGV